MESSASSSIWMLICSEHSGCVGLHIVYQIQCSQRKQLHNQSVLIFFAWKTPEEEKNWYLNEYDKEDILYKYFHPKSICGSCSSMFICSLHWAMHLMEFAVNFPLSVLGESPYKILQIKLVLNFCSIKSTKVVYVFWKRSKIYHRKLIIFL